MACGKCKAPVLASDLPVPCNGKCGRVFHCTCTTLTRSVAKMVTDNVNVLYKCDDCLSDQCCDGQNDELISKVNSIEAEVKKISSLSHSITAGIRDHIAAQIDSALKIGMEEMQRNVNGSLSCFEKLMCEKWNMMTSSFSEINADRKLAATNKSSVEPSKPDSESGRKNDEIENSKNVNENASFAEIVKQPGPAGTGTNSESGSTASTSKKNNKSNKKASRNTRPVIVIKPKESKQACEETRKFLKTQLNPKTHKISNFRNGKDGSVIVECSTGANVNAVRNGIEGNLGENYSAVVPTSVPRLKIVGMSDQYSSDVFIDYLRSQNEDIEIKDVKVVSMYENPRFTYHKFNVVIEVDVDTYKCLLCAKKVIVGFDECFVVPAINVLRCFKCGEFGHKSIDCKNGERCSKCSQQHSTSSCTSTVLKCVNCLKTNEERKMNLDVNHAAFSSECLVYKKLLNQKKSSLRFNK